MSSDANKVLITSDGNMSETSQTGSSMAATEAAAAEWGDADHDDDGKWSHFDMHISDVLKLVVFNSAVFEK